MAVLNQGSISQIIQEIQSQEEIDRRSYVERRQKIYRDGGKAYLLEQIEREFGRESIKEMRLAPVNVLKKIINKKSSIYKRPATRMSEIPSDQALVDFYSEELALDLAMAKANRYYNLHANTALYVIPKPGMLDLEIIPPHLYSVVPSQINNRKADIWVFNAFIESGTVTNLDDVPSATGSEGFSRQKTFKENGDLVNSQEKSSEMNNRRFIFWTQDQHFTTDEKGNILTISEGNEEYINPFGISPVVNLAKDRDNEFWALQGEDMIDLALAIQIGWSDILTIAKHQGFSLLTITGEEEPKQLSIGINKAVFLKQERGTDAVTPSISYVQAQSPLEEYKGILMDLLGLLLTTNDMSPGSVSGIDTVKNFTSGFQAMIEMSDALDAIEQDKPVLRDAEKELWNVIKTVHNWQFDSGLLNDKARKLGRFSEDFSISITYQDMKPIESEQERIQVVKDLKDLGLITKMDALKKLNPDMTDDQLEAKLKEIEAEKQENMDKFMGSLNESNPQDPSQEDQDGKEADQV